MSNRRRSIPLAVYPGFEAQVPLADLLDGDKRGDLIRDEDLVSCSDFILDIEAQIYEIFFNRKVGEFGDRTLGALFGFTGTDKIWGYADFDRAVKTLTSPDRRQPTSFRDFYRELRRAVKSNPPAPPESPDVEPDGEKTEEEEEEDETEPKEPHLSELSGNYALALTRWFSIWLDRRITSACDLLSIHGSPEAATQASPSGHSPG
jgi:hypothetical protein